MAEQPAAFDTSFWTVGHRADVLQYALSTFGFRAPPAVRKEILAPDLRFPRRRYGYAELYRLLEGRGLLPVVAPTAVGDRYGHGEAEAIALAQEHGWWLLINDYRPRQYARSLGIRTITVPALIFRLYVQEVISVTSAERKLDLIEAVTSQAVLSPVRHALDRLAHARKERRG
jgi:hypothetical protein